MSLCSFTRKFELNGALDKIFPLFTDTDLIGQTLPRFMKFHLLRRSSRHTVQDSFMEFQVRILGILSQWKSHTQSFSAQKQMIYVMQSTFLEIEHDYYFESLPRNHTRVTQCLFYKLPLGFFGQFINKILIRPYLERLLNYREKTLTALAQSPASSASKTYSSISRAIETPVK